MGLEPGHLDLLHDIPPTSATLDRDLHVAIAADPRTNLVFEPPPEPVTVRLPQPTLPHLPRLLLENVERDLAAMKIEPTYHAHQGPP
jgi:hypothetical protein